jgi:hypothetical protein
MYVVCVLCSLIELRMKGLCIDQHVTCTRIISVSLAKVTAPDRRSGCEICKTKAGQG